MRGVRRLWSLAAIAMAALTVAGCGVKAEPTTNSARFPSHAIDAAGAAISLATPPTRIVSLDPGATAILRDVGLADRTIVATTASIGSAAADPTTALIIVPLSIDDATLATIQTLSPVPVFRYGARPLAIAPTAIIQLGLAVGKGPEAARIARSVAAGLAALANRVANQGSVRVLIEGQGLQAFGPLSPVGEAVAAAGGSNVVSTDQTLTVAALAHLNIAAWVSLQPGGSRFATLLKFPEFARIPAIMAGRVIPVPEAAYPIDASLPAALQALADDLRATSVTTE